MPNPIPTVAGKLQHYLVPQVIRADQTEQGVFNTEDDVAAVLLADDNQNAYSPYDANVHPSQPKYLYRGQAKRFGRPWPPEDKCPRQKYESFFEGLIPSDYRYLEDWIANGRKKTSRRPSQWLTHYALCKEAAAYVAVCNICKQLNDSSITAWLNALRTECNSLTHTVIGSLAQHYAYLTSYLDLTSSIDVAFWMATHNWESGDYQGGSSCVIYRINYTELVTFIDNLNFRQLEDHALTVSLVDIRNTPVGLAKRPSAQHGWSLIGSEQHNFITNLSDEKIVEAFEFQSKSEGSRNTLKKSDIASEDVFARKIRSRGTTLPKIPSEERLQRWLDNKVNPVTGLTLDLEDPGWIIKLIQNWEG